MEQTLMDKLTILADSAKYDVACTSSGASRTARAGTLGSCYAPGCCHAFTADGRCVSLLKVLMTNCCAFDCSYCVNRRSNDIPRATFTPRELAELTMEFYRRNYIEGLFLSSAVLGTPDYTTERMLAVLRLLRGEYRFGGYIHAKAIPGTSPELLQQLGYLADRLSVNVELPSEQSLNLLAPDKGRHSIFRPMKQIAVSGAQSKQELTVYRHAPKFAPAGQSTQMIVGASPETDYHILKLTEGMYQKYGLKRVFYSAYIPVAEDTRLPALDTKPPLLREHRLYQADWLLRFYQFEADEILDKDNPNFNPYLDPKCNWAVQHYGLFPVDVNRAPFEMLLRVPGIGPKKASALIAQYGSLDEVIAHADEVKGKMGENLRAHIDDALLSRKVATIRTDAPVELDFDATSFPAFSADEVSAALGTLGITAMQNRFLALIGGEGGAVGAASVFEMPAMVRAAAGDAEALGVVAAEVSRAIEAGEWVAAVVDDDKEEGALFGLTRTLWLATSKGLFALEEGDGSAAVEAEGFNVVHGVIAGVLARLFMEGRVASPDMKTLLHELSPIDSSEPELMDPLAADSTRIFDTVVAAYLLDSDRSEFDEDYLADTYLQMSLPAARGAEGAGEDAPVPAARTAALTLALVAPLRDRMARENAANVFDGIEMPLVPVLAKMERAGMLVDPDRLHNLSEGLATQIAAVERNIRDLAGDETFNIGSPMQLSHVLFDVMGLPA